MAKYKVPITTEATAFAMVEVEADSVEEAIQKATSSDVRNAAEWELSDGNYIDEAWCVDSDDVEEVP